MRGFGQGNKVEEYECWEFYLSKRRALELASLQHKDQREKVKEKNEFGRYLRKGLQISIFKFEVILTNFGLFCPFQPNIPYKNDIQWVFAKLIIKK